ncbi:hypothetical protein GXM_07246 [Nostoc sphaeroides CCNUC1]|uniref:Uncharacterized protein n=1 Tax=Nostoc sphaeroides CCNUC1 TaxID=2653204 RepID=A0A5P8WAY6_9NOSO|nr:hypothetical protein GXM_07246 [Nostoc sphaeroides CCNUC1]
METIKSGNADNSEKRKPLSCDRHLNPDTNFLLNHNQNDHP